MLKGGCQDDEGDVRETSPTRYTSAGLLVPHRRVFLCRRSGRPPAPRDNIGWYGNRLGIRPDRRVGIPVIGHLSSSPVRRRRARAGCDP
jgi:hypothetical protein